MEGLKQNLATMERYEIEIEYLQYASRSTFPNPYHQNIMDTLNKMVATAIPDLTERKQFINQLYTIVAETQKTNIKK